MPLRDGELPSEANGKNSVRRRGSEVIFAASRMMPDFHRLRLALTAWKRYSLRQRLSGFLYLYYILFYNFVYVKNFLPILQIF